MTIVSCWFENWLLDRALYKIRCSLLHTACIFLSVCLTFKTLAVFLVSTIVFQNERRGIDWNKLGDSRCVFQFYNQFQKFIYKFSIYRNLLYIFFFNQAWEVQSLKLIIFFSFGFRSRFLSPYKKLPLLYPRETGGRTAHNKFSNETNTNVGRRENDSSWGGFEPRKPHIRID